MRLPCRTPRLTALLFFPPLLLPALSSPHSSLISPNSSGNPNFLWPRKSISSYQLFWYIIFKKKCPQRMDHSRISFWTGKREMATTMRVRSSGCPWGTERGVQAPGRKGTLSFSLDSLAAQWGAFHWKLVTRVTPFHLRYTLISFFAALNSLICSWNTYWTVYDIGGHILGTWVTKINKMR